MRILIRTSRLAIWARRLGSFALPLAVIPIYLHRTRILDSDTFALIETIALALAAAAFILGWAAFARLWQTGDRGWNRAATGVVLGGICLSPLVYAAFEAQRYPVINDVSTSPGQPIEMVVINEHAAGEGISRDDILAAFPGLSARDYGIGANEAYRLIEPLMTERGWEIIRRQPPQLETSQGQINALEMTLMGWRDEIAVRVSGDFQNARVEVRSASLTGVHDLGRNGRRIEEFLSAFDEAVTGLLSGAPLDDAPPVPATQGARD